MWQIRLKSVIWKLCIVSIYLLFLAVQLNLKFTFSATTFSHYSVSNDHNNQNKVGSIEKKEDEKPIVQKSRLNKRYVHQQAFLIAALVHLLLIIFYKKVHKSYFPVRVISSLAYCLNLLRGPPYSNSFFC